MALSLSKGGNISLSKTDPGLKNILIGLGWDERATSGNDFDLDASVFMINSEGKVRSDADFIFYGQLKSADGSVVHTGDNRTGEGEGDDEAIEVNLDGVPADIQRLVVTVTIHEADNRKQNFGMVQNAFIRVVNNDTGNEVVRYDLSEDYSTETALEFGEVYRHNGEWKFRAVGQGYAGGLLAMCQRYGVNATA
ncbi:TerD family protein [Halomonas sp. TBZ9]|uniref:TerD family protein n=1 Tax=Vreelandella azerica TaxID=2732867 RepID=A0A7Y3XBP8_9GAMM|nr:TerD family protein [Halomonas azerica]NOG32563.1 TerD family protein [Halomonas azerica]